MNNFIMCWPGLDIKVRCECLDVNKNAFDILAANLPIQTVQGHEMTGGWLLHDRAIHFSKQSFDISDTDLVKESMKQAPKGRISLLFPLGGSSDLLIKYDDCVDDREYIPIAQVVSEDLPKLAKVGKIQWKSTTRSKEIIVTKLVLEEEMES